MRSQDCAGVELDELENPCRVHGDHREFLRTLCLFKQSYVEDVGYDGGTRRDF